MVVSYYCWNRALARGNLGVYPRGGRTRRERTREHFENGRSYREKYLKREHASPVFPQIVEGPSHSAIPPVKPCPVCLHEDPGDLEKHLSNYHDLKDMRESFAGVLGFRQVPEKLAYLFNHGSRETVAKVISNYLFTGFLQIPTMERPRNLTFTRVLYSSVDKQPKF